MTSMFGRVGAAPAEEPIDKGHPVSTMRCGARVYGERLGHCPGSDCGYPTGCCRNFWGKEAFNRHHRMVDGRMRCYSDTELADHGFVQDRPENSWRLNTDTSTDPHEVEDPE